MPKYILEFNIPEEETEFRNAINGVRWALVVWKLDQHIIELLKSENYSKSSVEVLQDIRKKIYELMEEENLTFNDQ